MVAVVTGASSGIGRDIAIELAKRKYDIIAIARNEEALIKLKEEVEKTYNVNVELKAMDLTDREGCIKLHEDVKAKYGAIDVLINDAGFGTCGEFTKTDLNKEIGMIDTNIVALHILTKLFLQDMVEVKQRAYNECCINSRLYAWPINGNLLFYKSICSKANTRH